APVTTARWVVWKDEARREVGRERQSVEIGRRERAQVLHAVTGEPSRAHELVAHDDVRALAQRALLIDGAHEVEERVLAFEHACGVEGPEGAREAMSGEADEHLGDA